MNVVVLDIGGSSLKIWESLSNEPDKGRGFHARQIVRESLQVIGDVTPDRISIGYPGMVRWGRPTEEPTNLGQGWIEFDFAQAFGRPVRIMNDAEMQALGGYEGGRMLYLGLGAGVGTTLITESGISQIALGLLPFKENRSFDDFLTTKGLEEIGLNEWRKAVAEASSLLKRATLADYVLIGGGGVENLDEMPEGSRRGGNIHAYFGGLITCITTNDGS